MGPPLRILHLEDSPSDAELVEAALSRDGLSYDLMRVQTRADFEDALQRGGVEMILSDFGLPSYDGLSALSFAHATHPEIPFIFVSGTIGEEAAVASLKSGAVDYVLKDKLERLPAAVRRAMGDIAIRVERRQAEETIREQAALLNIAHDAILVHDLEDRISFWNNGAQRLYGWTAQEAMGRKISEFLYRSIPEIVEQACEELFRNGEWRGELRQVTKDGKEITVDSHWTLVRDGKGDPKSILKVNTDITEKKRLEKQFLQAQRLENLGTLAGGIAHDLNNVLAPILMAAQLLKMKPLDEQQKQWCNAIELSAKRGGKMVDQVLAFSRGSGGERVPLQIRHVVTELEKITHETFPRSIRFRTSLPDEVWTIVGDFTQLYQVLLNLCVNARDSMPNGGVINIEAENLEIDDHYARLHIDAKPGRYIVLTVSDTGTGIPPVVLDKIFDPFFTTKEVGKGTGLGLSTVLGIVKSHGGFVRVYSEVGKGTDFKIYLPADPSQVIESEETTNLEQYAGHGELVLVADDEIDVLEMTRMTLEAYGYRACLAKDGAEAVALYVQQRDEIAVVITDTVMPYMDGIAMARALQKLNPAVKIVMVSGLDLNEKGVEANAGHAVTFLRKPYTSEVLLRTLHGALHQEISSRNSVIARAVSGSTEGE